MELPVGECEGMEQRPWADGDTQAAAKPKHYFSVRHSAKPCELCTASFPKPALIQVLFHLKPKPRQAGRAGALHTFS